MFKFLDFIKLIFSLDDDYNLRLGSTKHNFRVIGKSSQSLDIRLICGSVLERQNISFQPLFWC